LSPGRVKKTTGDNFYNFMESSGVYKYPIPVDGKLPGHKPCARDGHSAAIIKNKMLIFGGDRHKMSFNDVYIFNLEIFFPNEKSG